MPRPAPDDQRTRVLELARAGAGRNAIAREANVSTATVTRVCRAAGITFDRQRTDAATKARRADLAAARVDLAAELLDDVAEARARMRAAETPRDFLDLAKATTSLTLAHVRLAAVDNRDDERTEQTRSMLGALADGLRAYAANEDTAEAGIYATHEEQTTVAVWHTSGTES